MQKSKRNQKNSIKRNLWGLLIVILLSLVTILWFSNKSVRTSSTHGSLSFIKLSDSNSNYNTFNATSNHDSDLILVNKWHPIPENYNVDLIELSNGKSVAKSIYPALQEMFNVARANGIFPIVVSGYRTAEEQQRLMDERITTYVAEGLLSGEAIKKASEWVATPGTSEHQLGIAVDINADNLKSTNEDVYAWLHDNAHNFGFICRYPANKAEITGINYEPWHYRYVGADVATEIYQQGVCLEEYLGKVN